MELPQKRPRQKTRTCPMVVSLLLLACQMGKTVASFTKIVAAGHTDCVSIRVATNVRGAYLSGNFFFVDVVEPTRGRAVPATPPRVDHGSFLRARLLEVATQKELWASQEGANAAHFTAQGAAGKRYQLCLSNGDVRVVPRLQRDGNTRQIGFHLRVHPLPLLEGQEKKDGGKKGGDDDDDDDKHEDDDDDDDDVHFKVEPLEELTYDLFDKLDDLLDMYEYFQIKESGQWTMVTETLSAVTWWAMIHLLFVLVGAGMQVAYIRRVVEKKRYL